MILKKKVYGATTSYYFLVLHLIINKEKNKHSHLKQCMVKEWALNNIIIRYPQNDNSMAIGTKQDFMVLVKVFEYISLSKMPFHHYSIIWHKKKQ